MSQRRTLSAGGGASVEHFGTEVMDVDALPLGACR